ncbi:MAG: arsenate reductase ArsC [Planctomycetia bacterium]|jgi:arsenate reductase|nr:arsenate reductase ArsC [Planctomycetia bacterium]MCC7313294.1 arsenate reductase ArsC [Planctomycetota bacterium]OQZ05458.1 MAG: low molecular weight phosphatase family protein [Planctomycetes bacterium UTPLA1]
MSDAELNSSAKKRAIILCTGNSCRSQMAEALWRKHGGASWEVVSAGTQPKDQVYPLAVQAMAESGIDISGYRPKDAAQFTGQHFDLVVTVCDNAERECPAFANADKHLHWPFDDPPKTAGDESAKLQACRRVRDEIEAAIARFLSK